VTSAARWRDALAGPVDTLLEASVAGSFSRIGYDIRSRLLPQFTEAKAGGGPPGADYGPALAGQTVVITGATSGIGLAAAGRLAGLGASVHFLARNRERAERAASQIRLAPQRSAARREAPTVSYGLADMTDLESVRRFAADVAAAHERLDVLIHNAGAIFPRYERVPAGSELAGLELTVASQVIAPFLLTALLFGQLRESAPARVITVSSGGMYTQSADLARLEITESDYSGVTAYARAKRAQVALSAQWAGRTTGTGVAFHAMHPGWVRTPGIAESLPAFSRLMGPVLRTPDQGADTIVWLACADPAILGSGRFWHDRRPRAVYRVPGAPPGPPDAGRRLWDWAARQAGLDPDSRLVPEDRERT
jgi:dehydrogenase/reductase SDR family member 12